mmetsp:Transcript_14560/g.38612  ORF Transcript_14560/g.38612 Transcript_14560/m.38612 type:complete len:422 (-) Transcript_14560:51-1316(-)
MQSLLELGSRLGALRGVSLRVALRADSAQLAALGDDVVVGERLAGQVALQDLADAGGVAGLGRERRAGHVRRHAVVRHRPPRVALGRRLREPHVPRVAGELALLEGFDNGVPVADLAAGRVDDVGAALHLADELPAEHVLRLRVQGAVDGHHVADPHHGLDGVVEGQAQLLLDLFGQAPPVGVVEVDVERLEAAQHGDADATRRHGADVHALEVVGPGRAVRDVPAALQYPVVRRQVVAHQAEDHHHHVLGDGNGVAEGDLRHGDAGLAGRREVHVVAADPGRDAEPQLRGLGDALGGHVGGPEGLRDHDLRVAELALQHRVRAVLRGRDHEPMAALLQELAQAQLAAHGPEELAGPEVHGRGRGRRLTIRVALDLRDVAARVGLGVALGGVLVQDADHLHHRMALLARCALLGGRRWPTL